MTTATVTVPLETNADGVWVISGTRVTLDTLVASFQAGATAEEIALRYPSLALPDIYAAISYFLHNPREVETYLEQRRQQAALVREENERRFAPDGLRSRLLARRSSPQD